MGSGRGLVRPFFRRLGGLGQVPEHPGRAEANQPENEEDRRRLVDLFPGLDPALQHLLRLQGSFRY